MPEFSIKNVFAISAQSYPRIKIKGGLEAMDSGIVTFVGVSDDIESGWMGTTSNHGLCIGSNVLTAFDTLPETDFILLHIIRSWRKVLKKCPISQ